MSPGVRNLATLENNMLDRPFAQTVAHRETSMTGPDDYCVRAIHRRVRMRFYLPS
jgi:hypothetical protein